MAVERGGRIVPCYFDHDPEELWSNPDNWTTLEAAMDPNRPTDSPENWSREELLAEVKRLREALLRRIAKERLVEYPGEKPENYMRKIIRSQLEDALQAEIEALAGGEDRG